MLQIKIINLYICKDYVTLNEAVERTLKFFFQYNDIFKKIFFLSYRKLNNRFLDVGKIYFLFVLQMNMIFQHLSKRHVKLKISIEKTLKAFSI